MNKPNSKKLTLSISDKKISGVCGGVAKYFDLDVSLVRILMLLFILVTGFFPGLLFYIIASIVIPKEGEDNAKKS